MATFIQSFRPLATVLFMEMAAPATLSRISRAYDPETRDTVEKIERFAARAVLISPSAVGVRDNQGALTLEEYAMIGEIEENVAPQPDDCLTVGAATVRISGVTPIRPDGSAICYRLALGEA